MCYRHTGCTTRTRTPWRCARLSAKSMRTVRLSSPALKSVSVCKVHYHPVRCVWLGPLVLNWYLAPGYKNNSNKKKGPVYAKNNLIRTYVGADALLSLWAKFPLAEYQCRVAEGSTVRKLSQVGFVLHVFLFCYPEASCHCVNTEADACPPAV